MGLRSRDIGISFELRLGLEHLAPERGTGSTGEEKKR